MINEWYVNETDLPKGVVQFSELLCRCGEPIICWEKLQTYLTKCASNVEEEFYHRTENPLELFFMYVLYNPPLGLTEHGSSIYGSWITNKGREVLTWLNGNIDNIDNMVITYGEG
jgi:hypothetical protein